MYPGRTVFAQLVELLPRRLFENAVERYGGQGHVRSFSCMDPLLCLIFAQITGRASLRETVAGLRPSGPGGITAAFAARCRAARRPTPNAVKAQLWIAVIVYVPTVKLKHRYPLRRDLNELLQIHGVTILEKTPVSQLFSEVGRADAIYPFRNQLLLFDL